MPAENGEGVFSGVGVTGGEVNSTAGVTDGGGGSGLAVGVGAGSLVLVSDGDGRSALGGGSTDGLAARQAASKRMPRIKR